MVSASNTPLLRAPTRQLPLRKSRSSNAAKTRLSGAWREGIRQLQDVGRSALACFDGGRSPPAGALPFGVAAFDVALQDGGLPRGHFTELFGPPGSGKSVLGLRAVAETQRRGGNVVYVDSEYSLCPKVAHNIGVDIESLIWVQPDNGEQAFEIVRSLLKTRQVSLVVVDSVAALVAKAEMDSRFDAMDTDGQVNMMDQEIRKLLQPVQESQCAVLFLNQMRRRVNDDGSGIWVTPGGDGIKFYSKLRLELGIPRACGAGAVADVTIRERRGVVPTGPQLTLFFDDEGRVLRARAPSE